MEASKRSYATGASGVFGALAALSFAICWLITVGTLFAEQSDMGIVVLFVIPLALVWSFLIENDIASTAAVASLLLLILSVIMGSVEK